MASASPASSLARRVSTLPRSMTISQVGPPVQRLGLAAQAGGAQRAPCGSAVNERGLVADEGVARVLALGDRGDDQARRQLGRHVLHRMDGAVDAAVQQRLLDLLGEQPLAADLQQPAVLHAVAGGGDRDQRRDRARRRSGPRPARRRCARCIMPAWASASLEPRVPMRTSGCDGRRQRTSCGAARGRDAAPATRSRREPATGCNRPLDSSSASRPAATRPPPPWCAWTPDGRAEVLSSVVASQIAAHAPLRRRGAGDRGPRPCRADRAGRAPRRWREAGVGARRPRRRRRHGRARAWSAG